MFQWNSEKNQVLQKTRGITFDEIVQAIADGYVVGDGPHSNQAKYPHQRVLAVAIHEYVYLVPYVVAGNDIFMKTIIPSRKATKKFRGDLG